MLLLLLLTTLVMVGCGQDTNLSPTANAPPKASSLWQKITKPIMNWFAGGNGTKEEEFGVLWTKIFEDMKKEILRVYNRRMNEKDGTKTANGAAEEMTVKVPKWEDIYQFVYVNEQTIFMDNTFESAAEKAYSCKRALEVKEWSFNELKDECKLPKKMGRKSVFKLWTEKTKLFEAGQSVFECVQWTERQEAKKLNKIFDAFLDGAPLPANICYDEEFKEMHSESVESEERKELKESAAEKERKKPWPNSSSAEKSVNEIIDEKSIGQKTLKRRESWERIRAQWAGKEAERRAMGEEKKKGFWIEESSRNSSQERNAEKRKAEKGTKKKRKISPQKRLMRKKVESRRNSAEHSGSDLESDLESDQFAGGNNGRKKNYKKKIDKNEQQSSDDTRYFSVGINQPSEDETDRSVPKTKVESIENRRHIIIRPRDQKVSSEAETDQSKTDHRYESDEWLPKQHQYQQPQYGGSSRDISQQQSENESDAQKHNIGQANGLRRRRVISIVKGGDKSSEHLPPFVTGRRSNAKELDEISKLETKNKDQSVKSAILVDDYAKELEELFNLANAEPALWLNDFGEISRGADDQRVAQWDCHMLTDSEQRAHCRSWEDVHHAIKRFIKFRLAKETKNGQNGDTFLTKVAIRPHFFAENKQQLLGQSADISLNTVMEQAHAVHSGQLALDESPPAIWNRGLVERVEEWAEFLNNLLDSSPMYRTNRQNRNQNETIAPKVAQTDTEEEKHQLNEARQILQMVKNKEQILEGMADEQSVPLLPYHIPRRRASWSISRNQSERTESASSATESRSAIRIRKIKINKAEKTNEKNEIDEETKNNDQKNRGNDSIIAFARRHNPEFWLRKSLNWNCKRLKNNGDRCEGWDSIHRAICRYLTYLEIVDGKAKADFRESDLAKVAVFPRLRPDNDSNGLTINNKGWIARLWGKIMIKDNGQYMDLKEAMGKVEEAYNLIERDQLKEPMELMNKVLVERVEGWAQFYVANVAHSLDPLVEEAHSTLTYVLVKTYEEKDRIMPAIDMKMVKEPPTPSSDKENNGLEKEESPIYQKSDNLPTKGQRAPNKSNGRNIITIKASSEAEEHEEEEEEAVPAAEAAVTIVKNRVKSARKTMTARRRKSKSNSKSKEAIWKRKRMQLLNTKSRAKLQKMDGEDGQQSSSNETIWGRNIPIEEGNGEEHKTTTNALVANEATIWEQKREFNDKLRTIIKEIFTGECVYLVKGKPTKMESIWPIFDKIESARDEKQLKNAEKMVPPKETDNERETREQLLQKWKEIELKLREQTETYGNEAYATRLKNAKMNAPNQLVIVSLNFFGFKTRRVVLIPSSAEIVHTVYQVKNGNNNNSYSMFGTNVFESWKMAAKCVDTVQNGQIYVGGKECKVDIEAESRAEMFRKWTNLGKALQFKIGALYKENDGMFDDQKLMLLLEQAYGALLNGSALPQLPPNVSGTVEQKLYGEMLEKSAQMNERNLSRALSFVRQKSILSENPIGDMKRTLSEKAREMLYKVRTGKSVYLVKTKPVNADTIWRLFDQIEKAHDEKALKNVEKQFPDEGPAEMRDHQLHKWQEIEEILREQLENYGRERYALRQQNANPNEPNSADDVLVLNESKFFGLLRKRRSVLIPNVDEIVHTVYRIEKPDKKTGFVTIQHFGPNIFAAWKRAAQCLNAVQSGQHYASANEECQWQMRTEYRRDSMYKRWTSIGKAVKRGLEAPHSYKNNEEVLNEQKLLQLLEKAFAALVNGTELPIVPEKISPHEANGVSTENGTTDQRINAAKGAEEAAGKAGSSSSWWQTLRSYLPA